ncbi:anthrone oxygenase family protein [Streptomyces albus]|uniref:anthrone oxygenase family protein n=1 Tax=Streptomyces TaxID=1883 RepID=UPI0004BD88B3|nr:MULTISPECIES: anthrone oxygenase family protein [unclassified Streptomyces]KPC68810.1 membrane protein [Streptomyces sp. NRRL F-6602]
MRELQGAALLGAVLLTGLSAGLYYGFAVAVLPGLRRAGDRTFVEGMQRINVAILNGWFLLLFAGSLLLILGAGALRLWGGGGTGTLPWIVAAAVLYLAVLVITMKYNVPLNDALDAGGLPGSAEGMARLRAEFEDAWVRWNIVRTVCNTAAFGCLAWALVRHGNGG